MRRLVRLVVSYPGTVRRSRLGLSVRGSSLHVGACYGVAVKAGQEKVGSGMESQGGQGQVRPGPARSVKAVMEWPGPVRRSGSGLVEAGRSRKQSF